MGGAKCSVCIWSREGRESKVLFIFLDDGVYQTMFRYILEPYSKLDTKNPYPMIPRLAIFHKLYHYHSLIYMPIKTISYNVTFLTSTLRVYDWENDRVFAYMLKVSTYC